MLIISLLYTNIACYSTKMISGKDEIKATLGIDQGIYVYVKDKSEPYHFPSLYHYQVLNDTLTGYIKTLESNPMHTGEQVRFALSDIEEIEIEGVEEVSIVKSTSLGLIIAVTVGTAIFFVALGWQLYTNKGFF